MGIFIKLCSLCVFNRYKRKKIIGKLYSQSRQTYDPTASKVDMAKGFLPKPMAATREAMLAVHMSEWERVRVSIKKDIANNDKDEHKTGKFAILSMEDYMAAGMVHASKDEEVTEEYVKNNQRVLNGHCNQK